VIQIDDDNVRTRSSKKRKRRIINTESDEEDESEFNSEICDGKIKKSSVSVCGRGFRKRRAPIKPMAADLERWGNITADDLNWSSMYNRINNQNGCKLKHDEQTQLQTHCQTCDSFRKQHPV
jgi:hypothetical protein